jgi:hypothetical protein
LIGTSPETTGYYGEIPDPCGMASLKSRGRGVRE